MKRYQLWVFLRLQLNYLWVVHFQLLVVVVAVVVVMKIWEMHEIEEAEES
jgi:hypothetical protein